MEKHPALMLSSSSPSSSGGIESVHGTPETKSTAFSPENVREQTKVAANKGIKVHMPPAFSLHSTAMKNSPKQLTVRSSAVKDQDPFAGAWDVDPSHLVLFSGLKLSPTATSFTPSAHEEKPTSIAAASSIPQPNVHRVKENSKATRVAPSFASEDVFRENVSKMHVQGTDSEQSSLRATSKQNELADRAMSGSTPPSGSSPTRYLMISRVPRMTNAQELNFVFIVEDFAIPNLVVLTDLKPAGIIYVKFTDLREAQKAYAKLRSSQPDWHTQYIGVKHFVLKYQPQYFPFTSDHEGQISVTALFCGSRQCFDTGSITNLVTELLHNYGDVSSCDVSFCGSPRLALIAEFFDVAAACMAVSQLDGFKVATCYISAAHYTPDISSAHSPQAGGNGPLIIGHEETGIGNSLGAIRAQYNHQPLNVNIPASNTSLSTSEFSPASSMSLQDPDTYCTLSPTSGYTFNFDQSRYPGSARAGSFSNVYLNCESPTHSWEMLNPGSVRHAQAITPTQHAHGYTNIYEPQHPAKNASRQQNDYASSHHNVVDIDRICQGLDVRTTIMLRNIPNKIDQAMLKSIVDETSRGRYDFMYLRIDFANNCNVGYAFINFEDPWSIIDFVKARAGHRWNRFNSDKVAEVSYATIQGKDCLVQKFRNSSVMLEHPSFRPKIFHTGSGPLAGEEDKFPGPDNPSKMRRSVENAEHVGLFAPRAGQHFRDEQRRRRSQYDRGTRLAELEDSYDDLDYQSKTSFSKQPLGWPSSCGVRFSNVLEGF